MKNDERKTDYERPEKSLDGRSAIVQCLGFRCWAKRDKELGWLDLRGNKVNVVEIVTVFG